MHEEIETNRTADTQQRESSERKKYNSHVYQLFGKCSIASLASPHDNATNFVFDCTDIHRNNDNCERTHKQTNGYVDAISEYVFLCV